MDRGGLSISDLHLLSCTFDNCGLSLTNDLTKMSSVSAVQLTGCSLRNSVIGPCLLQDVLIDGLSTADLLIVWGAFFRHVTLRGRIGNIKINRAIHDPRRTAQMQAIFDLARDKFYAACDWALDITKAELCEFSIEGVPTHLIRRDPDCQVVVNRSRLHSVEQISGLKTDFPELEFTLRMFLTRSSDPDLLLVAPKGRASKYFKSAIAGLSLLREMGVVQPD
jgi:hypothetical protein